MVQILGGLAFGLVHNYTLASTKRKGGGGGGRLFQTLHTKGGLIEGGHLLEEGRLFKEIQFIFSFSLSHHNRQCMFCWKYTVSSDFRITIDA